MHRNHEVNLEPGSSNSYVARQAIVSANRGTFGYELLFKDGRENSLPDISLEAATASLIVENQLDFGIEKLVGRHRAFINFSEHALLESFPLVFDKDRIAVEILETVNPSDQVIAACTSLKEKGYSLALVDRGTGEKWNALGDLVDIVKFDISTIEKDELARKLEQPEMDDKRLIAEQVETHEQFKQCRELGFDYFQGYFFSKPELLERKRLPVNVLLMLEILSESGIQPMNFDKINELVSRDVGLSYKLLKFINSPAIGVARDIKSLSHAMTYLGEAQLRKFVSLVSLASIGHEKPPELLSLATIRARFCELLAHDLGNQKTAGSAFLCGLLSLVDAVMDDSLEMVFLKLPIDEDIKAALRGSSTEMGNSLKMVIAYERGEWRELNELSKALDITESKLGSNYREAICWARDFETGLTND